MDNEEIVSRDDKLRECIPLKNKLQMLTERSNGYLEEVNNYSEALNGYADDLKGIIINNQFSAQRNPSYDYHHSQHAYSCYNDLLTLNATYKDYVENHSNVKTLALLYQEIELQSKNFEDEFNLTDMTEEDLYQYLSHLIELHENLIKTLDKFSERLKHWESKIDKYSFITRLLAEPDSSQYMHRIDHDIEQEFTEVNSLKSMEDAQQIGELAGDLATRYLFPFLKKVVPKIIGAVLLIIGFYVLFIIYVITQSYK